MMGQVLSWLPFSTVSLPSSVVITRLAAYDLFLTLDAKQPSSQRLEQLTDLFLASPTLVRKGHNPARRETPNRQVLNFWKRQRKIVF